MVRGQPASALPAGVRQDTRKHTRHVLRPAADDVAEFLGAGASADAFARFAARYREVLEERFRADSAPFDALARLALGEDVWLGCSCPSRGNPDVQRCHTVLALAFMKEKYPELEVVFPYNI